MGKREIGKYIYMAIRVISKNLNKMYLFTPGLEPATSGSLVQSLTPRSWRPSENDPGISRNVQDKARRCKKRQDHTKYPRRKTRSKKRPEKERKFQVNDKSKKEREARNENEHSIITLILKLAY